MKLNKITLALAAFGALVTLSACGSNAAGKDHQVNDIKKAGVLRVALSPDYPPFEFQMIKNGKNVIVGSDIDLANSIGKKLGVKVKIESMDFNNILASLSSGKADIAISGITKTPLREKSVNFSDVYYPAKNYLVIKKTNLDKYTSFDKLKHTEIAAQKGTTQESIIKDQFKDVTEISLAQNTEAINEVKNGQVQGAVIEEMIAKSFVSANPDLALAKIKIKTPKDNAGSAVALPKGSNKLTSIINDVIKEQRKNGQIDKSIAENYKLSQENK